MNFNRVNELAHQNQYFTFPIKVGQQLEIHEYMGEGEKDRRIRKFKGLVIEVHNPSHHDGSFTVIGETSGVKIEKTYPMSFTKFAKLILLDEFKVRRSRIRFIKEKVGKGARLKSLISKDTRWSEISSVAC